MRIFLRLGATELRESRLADDFTEDVFQLLRFPRDHVYRQAFLVFGHRRVVEVEFRPAIELLEIIHHKRPRDLAGTISAVIVKQHRIPVAKRRERLAVGADDPRRGHKLIAFLRLAERTVVITLNRGRRARRRRDRLSARE